MVSGCFFAVVSSFGVCVAAGWQVEGGEPQMRAAEPERAELALHKVELAVDAMGETSVVSRSSQNDYYNYDYYGGELGASEYSYYAYELGADEPTSSPTKPNNSPTKPNNETTSSPTSSPTDGNGKGPDDYQAKTVADAWKNHFDGFAAKDVDKIMLDYCDSSVLKAYDFTTKKLTDKKGKAGIREFFTNLFQNLDTAHVNVLNPGEKPDVTEKPKHTYLLWEAPKSGIVSATDTFIYDPENKIVRQNIAMTTGTPSA